MIYNKDDIVYVYENHLGGYFVDDKDLDYSELYCEECGDNDKLIYSGTVKDVMNILQKNIEEAKKNRDPESLDPDYDVEIAMIEYSDIAKLLGVKNPYKETADAIRGNEEE